MNSDPQYPIQDNALHEKQVAAIYDKKCFYHEFLNSYELLIKFWGKKQLYSQVCSSVLVPMTLYYKLTSNKNQGVQASA